MMSVGQMGCFLWSVCDWNIYQKMIRILVYRGLINEFSHDVPQNTVFCRKRKKEKSFFTTSPTHCSEMLLNLKPKSHFWLYKRYKCLIFFRCMNLFDYRLYVFHTLFGTVLLTGPKNSLVTRGAARKYVICWRVKNIQREKICQHKGRLEKLSNFFLWRKAGEKVNFLLPIHSQYVVPHTHPR